MKRTPVNSSMVASIGYDETNQLLEIEFVSNAEVHQYEQVSKDVFKALLNADSKGKFMRANIMNKYQHKKI